MAKKNVPWYAVLTPLVPIVLGLMAAFNQILGVSDPTSTQTVWSAEYAGVRPEEVMTRTLPFTWLIAAAAVVMTAIVYYH